MWAIHTFKTINQNNEILFTHLFQLKIMDGQNLSQQLRMQGRNQPWTRPHFFAGCKHTHTHTHLDWNDLDTINVHIFGIWKETRAPRENPCRHGGNHQALHRQWPLLVAIFFSIICVTTKWHWMKGCYSKISCMYYMPNTA